MTSNGKARTAEAEVTVDAGEVFVELARVLGASYTLSLLERIKLGPVRYSDLESIVHGKTLDRRLESLLRLHVVRQQTIRVNKRDVDAYVLDDIGVRVFDFKEEYEKAMVKTHVER